LGADNDCRIDDELALGGASANLYWRPFKGFASMSSRLRFRSRAFALTFVAVAATAAADALAAEHASDPAASGQRAYVDPETGRLTSPPEGFVAEPLPEPKAVVPMELTRSASGHKMLKTNGRVRAAAVAHIGPDGRVHEDCVDGDHVAAALHGDAPER
jgi:hypothetical protein